MPWLLKAEPESRIVKGKDVKFTIDDLQRDKVAAWDGVRNSEAKKFLSSMKKGDLAFFYRSNCAAPGIVGTMRVVRESYPDETAADPSEPYYDPKNPEGKWVVVDVEYVSHVEPPILLSAIKAEKKLANMFLVKRSRLSVSPVTEGEWDTIMQMHANDDRERNNKSEAAEREDQANTEPSNSAKKRSKSTSKDKVKPESSQKGEQLSGARKPPRKLRRRRGS